MRRTYRSKKETGDCLDPRDVIFNTDTKSSVFDAFYIQNIKQTKRELSVGTYMFAASKKVRKRRKYIKRVKEQKASPRESATHSAYLTPDKSIHVKKELDPFDMLFNSTTANENLKEPPKDGFSLLQIKRKGGAYFKKKKDNKKRLNYSNSNTDSDKENSNSINQSNISQNNSDVLGHQLLIENDHKQKNNDDSIYNIVKDLPLLKNKKSKDSLSPQYFSTNRNRKESLRKSVPKSPLCSTPFLKRGIKSFMKFSPISIIFQDEYEEKEYIKAHNESVLALNDTFEYVEHAAKNDNQNTGEKNIFTSNEIINSNEVCSPILQSKFTSSNIKNTVKNSSSVPLEMSSHSLIQTSEIEPFLGFSYNTRSKVDNLGTTYKKPEEKLHGTNHSVKKRSKQDLEEQDDSNHSCVKELDKTCPSLHHVDVEVTASVSISNNDITESNPNVSNYSTKGSIKMVCPYLKESIKDENESISDNSDTSQLDTTNDIQSLYDTCNSDSDFTNEKEDYDESSLLLEKQNDSVSLNSSHTKNDYSLRSNKTNESTSNNSDKNESSIIDKTSTELENISDVDLPENSLQEYSTINISNSLQDINDCDSDSNDNEEDNCISFVTTRKKNEVTKDWFIENSLENSLTSISSNDFDKTVLSKKKVSISPKLKSNITLMPNQLENSEPLYDTQDSVTKEILENESINIRSTVFNDTTKAEKNEFPRNKCLLERSLRTDQTSDTNADNTALRNSFVANEICMTRLRSQSEKEIGTKQTSSADYYKSQSMNFDKPHASIDNDLQTSLCEVKQGIVLQPGKRWERSLSIYRRMTVMADRFNHSILEDESFNNKGRKYRQSVISTMEMQDSKVSLHNDSIKSYRSTFFSKPSRSTIKILRESNASELSLCSTVIADDLQGFLTEDCDDTIIELSKLSIADSEHEVTVLEKFNDTSNRITTARDYVLRRCNQTDVILFDECYPDTVLKNCHKIGEGVYGEVFLWRAGDGRARVLKIVPIAGTVKVNGENQKDFHEIISEIVIAMELSALRAPIAEIEEHLDEGKGVETLDLHSVENATDIFNEVLAVRCVYGCYPSRLLDLWDLYDECKGSENDNPAILPVDQQFLVLELANAGQDLESYQFNNAEQAYSLFKQVAFGLAVAEEAYQFEHRDLHWGNVLISPTDQKYATFVLRGRAHRVARRGVSATIIDYSLSRLSLRLPSDTAALYNDLATDDGLFDAVGDYQFEVYRLMRDKLGNDWKNYEPYTNILWLHYTVDKMITALRYSRTNTKIHKHYIAKLKDIKNRILVYGSAVQYVLTDNEL